MLNKESKEKQRATKPDLIKLSVAELVAKKVEKREHIGEITKCVIDLEPMKTDDLYVLTCGHTVSSAAVRGFSTCPTCREPYSGPMTTTVLRPVMRDGVQVMEPITRVIEVKPVQNYMLTQVLDVGKEIEDIDAELEKRAKEQPDSQNQIRIKELTGKITLLEGQIKERDAKIETLKKSLFSQAEALSSTKEQLKERHTRELLESKQNQLKTAQTISSKDLEINELRNEVRKLKEQLSVMKAQLTKLEQPLEQSSAAPDMKHSQSGPVERKGKGKNKGKQTGAVSHSMAQPSVEENPAQQVAAHDAQPLQPALLAEDVPAPPREKAKAAGREPNKWHTRLGMLKMPVFAIINIGIGVILSKLTNFSPSDRVVNQQEPTTSIIPSVGTPNITSISGLKPYLPTLLAVNPEQALPDLAKLLGGVLTPDQFSQLIKEFERQQTAIVVDKPEEKLIAEQPTNELEAEDANALKQQFELVQDYFKRGDYASVLQGRALLQELVARGYSPAQRFFGSALAIMGRAINRADLVEQGRTLLQLAAQQGDEEANKRFEMSLSSTSVPKVKDIHENTERVMASGEWVNNDHFKKRFQTALQERYLIISTKITPSEKEQIIKKRNEAFENLKQLAEKEGYAPAQYWCGAHLLEASKVVDDENLKEQGMTLLANAAGQGVKEAADLLLDPFLTKRQDKPLPEAMDVSSASTTTADGGKPSAKVPDKNEEKTTAKLSVLSIQAEEDNNNSAATDKVSEESSSSESQQERFEKCEKYLIGQDRALILKGHDLLNALSVEGYPPAQYKFGTFMVHAGNAINIDGVINSGINLIRAAAQQGYQLAIDNLSIHTFKRAQLNVPGIQNITDIAGKEWKGNSHFKKQLKSALKKINDSGLKNDLTEAQNQQARDEGFKELQDLADLKDYAPAQYCLGCTQLVAGRYLNNAEFIQKGIMYLEKAAAQDVQQAADLLASDPFTKDRPIKKLSSTAQPLKEDITVVSLSEQARAQTKEEPNAGVPEDQKSSAQKHQTKKNKIKSLSKKQEDTGRELNVAKPKQSSELSDLRQNSVFKEKPMPVESTIMRLQTMDEMSVEQRDILIEAARAMVGAGPRSHETADLMDYERELSILTEAVEKGYTVAVREDFFDKSYYQSGRSPQEHAKAFNRYAEDLQNKQSARDLSGLGIDEPAVARKGK